MHAMKRSKLLIGLKIVATTLKVGTWQDLFDEFFGILCVGVKMACGARMFNLLVQATEWKVYPK